MDHHQLNLLKRYFQYRNLPDIIDTAYKEYPNYTTGITILKSQWFNIFNFLDESLF